MRLRGAGIGTGTAIGAAAIVRLMSGVPLPPEIPARILAERAGGRNSELPDVIVVAEEFRNALAISGAISWANVVGIAAERSETSPLPCPFPTVVGLSNLLETVADDMLLLLDATADILLADPDPIAIAQYQAEAEQLAPKRRFFLENAHLPATTSDGHTIQVIAITQTIEEVELALQNGADALYIPIDTEHSSGFVMPEGYHILPCNADASILRRNLTELISVAQGKPLYISDDYSLPMPLILKAAARADVTLALPPRNDLENLGIGEMREELKAALREGEEYEAALAMPRLAADLVDLEADRDTQTDRLLTDDTTCILISLAKVHQFIKDILPRIETIITKSDAQRIPVILRVNEWHEEDETLETAVRYAVGTGAAGLLTGPKVAEVKAVIRELNYADCRAEIERITKSNIRII